jgi:MraZ protein
LSSVGNSTPTKREQWQYRGEPALKRKSPPIGVKESRDLALNRARAMITGEFRRVYDDRHRIALPPELVEHVGVSCVIAKEREGCLSLWETSVWEKKVGVGLELIEHKLKADVLHGELAKVQRLGRLLATLARPIRLGQRGRLLVPEGFRQFLGVEPNSEVLVIGAGICVEIWQPQSWQAYLRQDIENFNVLFKELAS